MSAVYELRRHSEVLLIERSAPTGFMPPLHRRDEEETYRVISGSVIFFVDDQVVEAGEGDVVVARRGAARTFMATSASARWLVQTRVSSLGRYIDFGRAVAPPLLTGGWPAADELASVTAMAYANGIELLGPPGALPSDRRQQAA